ncbi:Scarecrow protein 3 [Spatholobus suberectus]|nr:Scarecrow protein 3 [Spatholobus suberectus]
MVHGLGPKVLVMVEQDSSHNGPFFLGRFMESLHYYSAIFDSLDVMLPKYDTKRAKMEQFYFAEEIKNIVSYEGPMRMERHERVDQWRRRMSRAGFQAAPVKMVAQAKQWLLKSKVCEGYTVVEEKGCLVLGWKSKPIVAVSCWKC